MDLEGPGRGFFAFPAAEHSVMSFTVLQTGRVLAPAQLVVWFFFTRSRVI